MIRSAALLCAAAVCGFGLPARAATFVEFDPQYSEDTYPAAISGGAVTGYYTDGANGGFLRAADGTITDFSPPNSNNTYPVSINKHGTVVGYYDDSSAVEHGFSQPTLCKYCFFIRAAKGTFIEFNPAGGGPSPAVSINDGGTIAGTYVAIPGVDGSRLGRTQRSRRDLVFHGFVRAANGKVTKFDPAGSTLTWAASINQSGTVTGLYEDSTATHGFVRAADGTITAFDGPQSTYTGADSINKAGTITGYYVDTGNVVHGFVRTADGTITTFDPSGSTSTSPTGIADSGIVTGSYSDGNGVSHGFIRKNTGKIVSFDVPGASQTFPTGIDSAPSDRNGITGYYEDSSGNYHGFLRTP